MIACAASEVSYLNGPGKGVTLIKLDEGDQLVGIKVALNPDDILAVRTSLGGEQKLSLSQLEPAARGGKGREIVKRGQIAEVVLPTPQAPQLSDSNGEGASV